MKRLFTASVTAGAMALALGCGGPTGVEEGCEQKPGELSCDIVGDYTIHQGETVTLTRHVFVKDGGTLNIEPGATLKGTAESSVVVTTSGKIHAVGTRESPIVFTSAQPEGSRKAGDWGGVVLLGKARINVAGGQEDIEGFAAAGDLTKYGGTDDAHDCGEIKYARIEFAGKELSKDNELNGLSVGACGSATRLEYIQVHRGADDGIEMFGGTASLKHVVVSSTDDDMLDWDLGYRGNVQFLVGQQTGTIGNYGFEADSNGEAFDAEPRSFPKLANVTLVGRTTAGSAKSIGMLLREGTAAKMTNFLVLDFMDGGIDVADEAGSVKQFKEGNLTFSSFVFWNIKGSNTTLPWMKNDTKDAAGNVIEVDGKSHFNEQTELFEALATSNKLQFADPMLTDVTSVTAPDFTPKAGSPALNVENVTSPGEGFEAAPYLGAVGTDNWLAGWTAYPEN